MVGEGFPVSSVFVQFFGDIFAYSADKAQITGLVRDLDVDLDFFLIHGNLVCLIIIQRLGGRCEYFEYPVQPCQFEH